MAVVRCCRIIKKTLNTTTHPFIEHNYSRCSRFLALRRQSSTAPSVTVQSYIHATDDKALNDIQNSFSIIPDFISEDEETVLYEEVQRYLKKLRYEFDHWDNVSTMYVLIYIICMYIYWGWPFFCPTSPFYIRNLERSYFCCRHKRVFEIFEWPEWYTLPRISQIFPCFQKCSRYKHLMFFSILDRKWIN